MIRYPKSEVRLNNFDALELARAVTRYATAGRKNIMYNLAALFNRLLGSHCFLQFVSLHILYAFGITHGGKSPRPTLKTYAPGTLTAIILRPVAAR